MSLFKLGTVDLTYVKVKINISIECYLYLHQNIICSNSYSEYINVYNCLSMLYNSNIFETEK